MNITPRATIQPLPIGEETAETYAMFQERSAFHESIQGFKVYINQYAWDAFINHGNNVYKQTNHEAQGIFLGKFFRDQYGEFAVATEYSEGHGESSHAYVGMSEECVAEISKKCLAENLLMLVWIHTHPNFGVFYSGTDTNCLRTNFFMPFQSGIVVDIIRRESKGFKVNQNEVNEFTSYYIYHQTERRLSKPYAIYVEAKAGQIKKKEGHQIPEFPTKEIMEEIQSVRKELGAIQNVRSEIAELKEIVIGKLGQIQPHKQPDPFVENKGFFEKQFEDIKALVSPQKDYTEYFENIVSDHSTFKRYLLVFLIGLSAFLILSGVIIVYFFVKSFFIR